jgi:hydrogenase maturation protein HypF
VLGIGGELKNTFCIGQKQSFLSRLPYVGDLADIRTVATL